MNKRKIIVGNWKMNPATAKEAEKLFTDSARSLSKIKKTEVVICAPSIYLEKLKKIRTTKIKLGGQDVFYEESGAYTGEISGTMLSGAGVTHVIIGHSERRALGETNEIINKKIKASLASLLQPIVCVGENTRDDTHGYFNAVKVQLEECLKGISRNSIPKIIVAYEPVWAISTTPGRKDATADDCREMAVFIRKILFDKFGGESEKVRVIYGGSVNEKDAGDFLKNGDVDGLLPGRASLDAKKFTEIVKTCEALKI